MTIVRYETVDINTVNTTVNSLGEQSTSKTKWFTTRALVSDVANMLRISERYRVYSDLINLTVNYTPNTRTMSINQQAYSITWRNQVYRITDVRESNDRQKVTFVCYRNDPTVPL
jgi:hypothetical protein